MKNKLMVDISTIANTQLTNNEIILNLQNLLSDTINFISLELEQSPVTKIRMISIGKVPAGFGVNYYIKRNKDEIIVSDTVFTLRKSTIFQNLIFLIIKESFMHFIQIPVADIIEMFVNFTVVLWIQKHFNINNIENPLIVTINRNIYPEEILGQDSYHYFTLFELLFKKRIDYLLVYKKIIELLKLNINERDIEQNFSSWVYQKTIKDEDVIAPILIDKNKETIFNYFIQKGYHDSSTTELASIIGKSDRTIQRAVRSITAKYRVFWSPIINYEKLRLHNYYLLATFSKDFDFKKIQDFVFKIPYVKNIYSGESDSHNLLYSPNVITPHITAESLKEKLLSLKNKGEIIDFTLQMYHEKFVYNTITTSKNKLFTQPSMSTYEQLLSNKRQLQDHLKLNILSHIIRDVSPIFTDDDILDYNLLFFLSYLNEKYFLSGSYGGWIHELPKLLEKNNKSLSRMSEAVTFLSQIEHRAIRRGFLSYYLYIRNITNKNPNVLLIETPLLNSNEIAIKQIRVFGFLYQFQLHDRTIFALPGISHRHPVRSLINTVFKNEDIEANFYTINLLNSKFVPLHDLFDYDERRWII